MSKVDYDTMNGDHITIDWHFTRRKAHKRFGCKKELLAVETS
jgi:hypothetical protein